VLHLSSGHCSIAGNKIKLAREGSAAILCGISKSPGEFTNIDPTVKIHEKKTLLG
jgi:hypothetical protein